MLFIEAVAIFLYLGFCVYKILFFKKVLKGLNILSGERNLIAEINRTGFSIIIGLVITGIILFLLWLYRLYRNIEATRNTTNEFIPFTRILALAIPFANLFIPGNVIAEICHTYTTEQKEIKTIRRALKKWRLLLTLIIIYSLYCIFMFYLPSTVNEVIRGIYYKIFLIVLCIHFLFLTMEVIELLNEMERKKRFELSLQLA